MAKRSSSPAEKALANAAQDAVSTIASATKDAASVLATAARDAAKVVAEKANSGESWDDYKKLVMSSLDRLNDNIEQGFDKMSKEYAHHDEEDTAKFAAATREIESLKTKIAVLASTSEVEIVKSRVAVMYERLDRQLVLALATALGSALAVASHWWK